MSTISLTPYGKAETPPDADAIRATGAAVVESAAFPVVLSPRAVEMVREALQETDGEDGDYLRVGIKGGGCAGFQYSLTFTDEVDEDDVVVVDRGLKVVTDTFSACYLKGTELDYVDSLQGSGFKFVNPNAKRTCGCGSSFAA